MKSPNEHARVFFALWPRQEERATLATWQIELQQLCGGRVMRFDTLHTTLVFLGEIEVHRLEALFLAAQGVAAEPFELNFDAAHYWGHNHIVIAAPSSVPLQLLKLVSSLEQLLIKHNFRFERHAYKPHVTLLRNAKWSDAELPTMTAMNWQISDFVLVHSDANGARYEVLAKFPISPASV